MTVATATPPLQLATVSSLDEFEALRGEWDDLVRAMPRPTPFFMHAWLETWWRHYGVGATLAVEVARQDGRLVGAVPLLVRPYLGVPVARFLGGRQSALGDLLLAADAHQSVATGLGARVAQSHGAYLDLYGLPRGSRLAQTLGRSLRVIERVEAPVLDLTDGWETVYREKTSSKKRNLHRRRRRQLGELGELRTRVAKTPEDVDSALDEAFRLHMLRWEGRPDGSGFVTAVGRQFHRAALRRLAEQDVARIVLLELAGRAIAFHYYLAFEGRMYVHRLGFDPAFARYSPGLVNTLDTLEAAAAEGLRRVEFLGGAERYKVELADEFDPICHGLGLARGLRARTLVELQVAVIRLRLRLKESPTVRHLYVDGLAPLRRLAARSRDALRP
jgi:CelD/BcsL family acetyltransferase involved in cellulose biosynthesis